MKNKLKLISLLFGLSLFAGCATYVGPPEPVVYYGYYGDYYGSYYYGPSGIVLGSPYGWHGHYYYGGPRGYYHGGYRGHHR